MFKKEKKRLHKKDIVHLQLSPECFSIQNKIVILQDFGIYVGYKVFF